jgi:hypothetical protein
MAAREPLPGAIRCHLKELPNQKAAPLQARSRLLRSLRYRVERFTKGLQERSIDTKLVGSLRMGARVVDWARLESVCTARYRGFESLPIRSTLTPSRTGLQTSFGPHLLRGLSYALHEVLPDCQIIGQS